MPTDASQVSPASDGSPGPELTSQADPGITAVAPTPATGEPGCTNDEGEESRDSTKGAEETRGQSCPIASADSLGDATPNDDNLFDPTRPLPPPGEVLAPAPVTEQNGSRSATSWVLPPSSVLTLPPGVAPSSVPGRPPSSLPDPNQREPSGGAKDPAAVPPPKESLPPREPSKAEPLPEPPQAPPTVPGPTENPNPTTKQADFEPASSTTDAATATPPAPAAIWTGDPDLGDPLAQWGRVEQAERGRVAIVGPPFTREGPRAVYFRVNPGETTRTGPKSGPSSRSELSLSEKKAQRFTEGQDRYFGWSTRFDPSWPNTREWTLIWQLHGNDNKSPPVSMHGDRNQLSMHLYDGRRREFPGVPIVRGAWHDLVVHVRFSHSGSSGFVEAWQNGQVLLRRTPHRTLNGGSGYLKMGIYRSPTISTRMGLVHDEVRVGSSYAAVAPRGARPGAR